MFSQFASSIASRFAGSNPVVESVAAVNLEANISSISSEPRQPCYIARVPLNDILWFCVVSVFLEVKDVAIMERAFTNQAFYKFQDDHGNRQGLFMNVNWDTFERPVRISSKSQVEWLKMRNIRLYNVQCVNLSNDTIQLILSTSHDMLQRLDLSMCNHADINAQTLSYIAQYCHNNLQTVILSGCDMLSNISILTKRCSRIKRLNLQSVYRMTNHDCEAIASDLPNLLELDLSYCDKITDQAIRGISSCVQLEYLSISGCPRLTTNSISNIPTSFPNLRHIDLARLPINDESFIDLIDQCRHLSEININGCMHLTSVSVGGIGRCIGDRLKKLYASDCPGMTDESLISIAALCPDIDSLNVSFRMITDESLKVLGQYCHHLRDIDMAKCYSITDKGITDLVIGCPFIRNIRLFGCNMLTNESVTALLTCSNLVGLDVRGCRAITSEVVRLVERKATVTLLLH